MAFELQMKVDQTVGNLGWNFDELNTAVDKVTERYRGLVITDEQIREAKEIRQGLNRLKSEINNRRIEAKKEFCEPYYKFEEQVKIVTGKIDEVVSGIDGQIKDFEKREKDAKFNIIEQWWYENCPTDPQVSYELVHDRKFLNKTCRDSEWQGALTEKWKQITSDLETISAIDVQQKRDYVLSEYLKSLLLADARGRWEVYSEQVKQAEEFRKRAEEKAQKAIEHLQKAQNQPNPVRSDEARGNPQPESNNDADVVYERSLHVWGTRAQIIALANFMNANGIKFKKVSE